MHLSRAMGIGSLCRESSIEVSVKWDDRVEFRIGGFLYRGVSEFLECLYKSDLRLRLYLQYAMKNKSPKNAARHFCEMFNI